MARALPYLLEKFFDRQKPLSSTKNRRQDVVPSSHCLTFSNLGLMSFSL